MTESLSGWLALREAADAAARSSSIVLRLAGALPDDRPLRIVDLGAGTGSNIRYLAPRLPHPQDWLAVDRDAGLLAMAPHGVRTQTTDLGALEDGRMLADRHLVTASALLDLVSEEWMKRLVAWCARHGSAVLFALSYDGRFRCDPPDADDEVIRELFNAHQRRNDKGFGRAAGPAAADFVAQTLDEHGYSVDVERSDWQLGPEDSALQRELLEGWATAAAEIAPELSERISAWKNRRLDHLERHASRIVVGHLDVAGSPKSLA
jgi:trans-aconitate methyltransferase